MTTNNKQYGNKAEPSSSTTINHWTVDEVLAYLHEHTGLIQYDECFQSNDINGPSFLSLSSDELKHDLGIKSLGHRKQILQSIEKLRTSSNSNINHKHNEYAMTACISASISSILTQHYNSPNTECIHPLKLMQQSSKIGECNQQHLVRAAVCMATEAAKYIVSNQQRIINDLSAKSPLPASSNDSGNCRKRVFFMPTNRKSNYTVAVDNQTTTTPGKVHFSPHLCAYSQLIRRLCEEHKQAKRSNRAWSDCDERQLIKLKSLNTLTWNKIGECLQRSGAACQLHWKTMKNIQCICDHIKHIKENDNGRDYYNHCDADYDVNVLVNIDKILTANQWQMSMLDTLWENVSKECMQKDDTTNKTMKIEQNSDEKEFHFNGDQDEYDDHIKQKRPKRKKKKKLKRKKHRHSKQEEDENGNLECSADLFSMNGMKKHSISRSNARWTEEEEQSLIQMLEQHKNMQQISQILGRTIPAINQHRLAMKHKHANETTEQIGAIKKEQIMKNNSENEVSSDESEEEDENIRRQQRVPKAVMTPIITPNSYLSNTNAMSMQSFNMNHNTLNTNLNRLNQTAEAYNNADYSANMSSTTTSSANSNSSTTVNQNGHRNPFKSMPLFSVYNKRALSMSPSTYHLNGQIPRYQPSPDEKIRPPPNKKARLCAMRPNNALLATQQQYFHPHHQHRNLTQLPLQRNGNIALPSLNTSFQAT